MVHFLILLGVPKTSGRRAGSGFDLGHAHIVKETLIGKDTRTSPSVPLIARVTLPYIIPDVTPFKESRP